MTTAAAPPVLRGRDVADLTVTSGYPCISILLGTEPAPRLTQEDRERLGRLVAHVEEELRAHSVLGRDRLLRSVDALVQRAAAQPADRGIAIYVNLAVQRIFRLAVPVTDRAVVEQTFATRPLLTALHRMPPHALLVLDPEVIQLFQVVDGTLGAVASTRFPADVGDRFLRDVDEMLGAYRSEHPSPLVLAGSAALSARFRRVSRNLGRLAGQVPPGRGSTLADLARASIEVVEAYLRSRRQEALGILAEARVRCPRDVATGMAECWQAVHERPPGMLLVEEDYVSAGDERVGRGAPVHDLVDDLMEVVIMRGGQLALVENGDLASSGRIALISRPTEGGPGRRTTQG